MQDVKVKDPLQQVQLLEINHWLGMLGRLQDPVVARLVLGFLNENPGMRAQHPGAFLIAAETVKRDQIRYAKAFAWGKLAKSVSLATGRGAVHVVKGIGHAASVSLSMSRKLIHWVSKPKSVQVIERAPATSWRRCEVRQRRGEPLAQRGAPRARS